MRDEEKAHLKTMAEEEQEFIERVSHLKKHDTLKDRIPPRERFIEV